MTEQNPGTVTTTAYLRMLQALRAAGNTSVTLSDIRARPGQADLFGATGRTDAPAVLTELEVDYTPCGVAVQLLLALRSRLGDLVPGWASLGGRRWPRRVLDPSAGSGCFGRAMRAVFEDVPSLRIMGIEPRESELANIQAAHDAAITSTLEAYAASDRGSPEHYGIYAERFDLVASNTPFSALRKPWWPDLLFESGLLADDAIVAFYNTSQWGQGEEAHELLRSWCPSLQIRVGGRVGHRGKGNGMDAREYSLWVWSVLDRERRTGKNAPLSWTTVQLPVLPASLREWSPSAVPGTYPIDRALVDEISGRYL